VTKGPQRFSKQDLAPSVIHELLPSVTETAFGSHPCCRSFSNYRQLRAFHGGNTGSNPVGRQTYQPLANPLQNFVGPLRSDKARCLVFHRLVEQQAYNFDRALTDEQDEQLNLAQAIGIC
jgi:hypothetical protein